ncbi:MAG: LysR substrate-binding domain-containing protein [Alsobacter sp.]
MAAIESHRDDGGEGAPIDLRRLRYFVAVCEHGGISRAAHALGMAQPALSRQIQLLEKEIGMPLFMRSGRGAEPSAQGRHLLGAAREQLRRLDDAVRDVRERFTAPASHVRLGVCPTIAPLFVDEVCAGVREAQPTLSLSVVKAYSGDIQNLLEQNQLDLALTYSTGAIAGFSSLDLLTERLVLVIGRGRAPGHRARHTLHDIASMPLILPTRVHALRRIIDEIAAERGVALHAAIELDSLEAVRSVLEEPASLYCTILPVNSVGLGVAGEALATSEIDDPGLRRTIALVQPRGGRGEAAADAVAEQVLLRAARLREQFAPA